MTPVNNNWVTKGLSPEQLRPFGRTSLTASILAGAGSGKTRTLIHLVADDIASGTAPEDIVLFTFTENAAQELRARITHLFYVHNLMIDLAKLKVGTIHSWCFQFLLEVDKFINISPIDELHLEALVSRLYDHLKLENAYSLRFPKGISKFVSDLEIFHNELLDVKDVPEKFQKQIELFQTVLTKNKLLTFGDMIRNCCNHLRQNGPVRNLKSIYVDEYQDVNPAQVSLIKLMRPSGCRLMVVGDELQSIYQWRGSDVSQILDFGSEFPNAEYFKLLDNYRSRPQILEAANKFAACISKKIPNKTLRTKRTALDVRPIIWTSFTSEKDEVNSVVSCVKQFLSNGVPENKIAILLRSVANRGKPFVDALRSNGISVWCPIHGRTGDFIMTFVYPTLKWISINHTEPRSEEEERETETEINAMQDSLLKWIPDLTLLDAFWEQLNQWLDSAEAGKNEAYNIREQLYTLMDVSGVRVCENDPELMSGIGIVSQIIRSVEEIHRRRIQGHERKSAKGVVKEVLYAIRRHNATFGESVPIDQSTNGVWVGTIHQSKGLEWPVVIIPMLKQRRFPINSKGHGTNYNESIAGRYGTTKDDERRLFYVAITRAKERLILSDPCRLDPSSRSEFINSLKDLPQFNESEPPKDCSQFWNISDQDLQNPHSESICIGLSELLLYLECPYQFGLRRCIGIQAAVGDELGYGLGLHELIQRRIEHGTKWSNSEIDQHTEQHVHLPLMSDSAEQVAKISIAKRICKLQDLGVLDAEILPEIPIELSLGVSVIHGIVDCLVRMDKSSYVVRDWKSNIHAPMIPRYERQMQFYAYALQVAGYTIGYADLVDVGATETNGRLITHQVDISETSLLDMKHLFERCINGIINHNYLPNPSRENCGNCDLYKICGERWSDATTN